MQKKRVILCREFYEYVSSKQLSELWVISPDNKKVCYIDPQEGVDIFNKYHTFDEVIEAKISIEEKGDRINVLVNADDIRIIQMEIKTKVTIQNRVINVLLKNKGNQKSQKRGKTETGKGFINKPERIVCISSVRVTLNEKDLGRVIKPRKKITFGDGEISGKPIINYCTHVLEE